MSRSMKHPWIRANVRWAKPTLGVLVVVSLASVLIECREQLAGNLQRIRPAFILVAVLICLLHRFMNAHGWVLVLRLLGQRLPMVSGNRIWQSSEACRWLPGSVWGYGIRAVQVTRYNVSSVAAGASMLAELLLTLAAAVAVILCAVVLYSRDIIRLPAMFSNSWLLPSIAVAVVTLAIVAGVICRARHDRWSQRVAEQMSVLGRLRPGRRRTVAVFGYYVFVCGLHGLGFYSLVLATSFDTDLPMMAAIGANSAAWLIGFFAIFAPGGLIIREGTLAVLVSPWLPIEQALTIAIAWRMIQILMEVVGVGLIHVPPAVQWFRDRCSARAY